MGHLNNSRRTGITVQYLIYRGYLSAQIPETQFKYISRNSGSMRLYSPSLTNFWYAMYPSPTLLTLPLHQG